MLMAIEKQEPSDPLIRAKITGRELTGYTLELVKDDHGIRVESALSILASLGGASCSFAMLDLVERGELATEMPEVAIATLKSGGRAMFGNYINRKLVEGETVGDQRLSMWGLIGGMAHHLGHAPEIDWSELMTRITKEVGGSDFGKVRVPHKHRPLDLPQNLVSRYFPAYLPLLTRYDLPRDQYWLAFGLSAQEVLKMAKDAADPAMMARLSIECAAYAAKIDMARYLDQDTVG